MRLALVALLVCPLASPASAQQLDRAQTCAALLPAMLQFIGELTKIEGGFANLYKTMAPEDKDAFAATKLKGEMLTTAAEDYRSEFLKACAS